MDIQACTSGSHCLAATLAYASDKGDMVRSLMPCAKSACQCAGIWYGQFGSAKRSLVVRVDLEPRQGASTAPPAAKAVAAFRELTPSVDVVHVDAQSGAECHREPALTARAQWRWQPDAPTHSAGGHWEVSCRPGERLTPDGTLAHLEVRLGSFNTVRTAPFEVRTKPSEWVLLSGLPSSAAQPSAVHALLQACAGPKGASLAVRHCVCVSVGGSLSGSHHHAFVQLKSRAQAGAVVLGAHSLRAQLPATPAPAKRPATGAADTAAAATALLQAVAVSPGEAGSFPSAWAADGGMLVSHIPSMNSVIKEDPALTGVPAPHASERLNLRKVQQEGAPALQALPSGEPACRPCLHGAEAACHEPQSPTASHDSLCTGPAPEAHSTASSGYDSEWDTGSLRSESFECEEEEDDVFIALPAPVAPVADVSRVLPLPVIGGVKRRREAEPSPPCTPLLPPAHASSLPCPDLLPQVTDVLSPAALAALPWPPLARPLSPAFSLASAQ